MLPEWREGAWERAGSGEKSTARSEGLISPQKVDACLLWVLAGDIFPFPDCTQISCALPSLQDLSGLFACFAILPSVQPDTTVPGKG